MQEFMVEGLKLAVAAAAGAGGLAGIVRAFKINGLTIQFNLNGNSKHKAVTETKVPGAVPCVFHDSIAEAVKRIPDMQVSLALVQQDVHYLREVHNGDSAKQILETVLKRIEETK